MSRRRRGAALEEAILEAAWEELSTRGYAATSIESVAARAATSKPVLYRRWPTKAELVLATIVREASRRGASAADTGSLRGDLVATMERVRTAVGTVGRRTMLSLLSELDDLGSDELPGVLRAKGVALVAPLVERARERGELGEGEVSPDLATVPLDLARHALLVRGELTDERIAAFVDQVTVPVWRLASGA